MEDQDWANIGYERGFSLAVLVMEESSSDDFDEILDDVLFADEFDRQMSPFELTVFKINFSDDPETAWAHFDDGIVRGAKDAIDTC